MALVSCIECGRQISDSARSCPACSANEPRGVTCELCRRQMRRSDGHACQRSSGGWDPSYSEGVAHSICIDRYFTPPATLACPDCGRRLAGTSDSWTAYGLWKGPAGPCPGCGAADVFLGRLTRCWECRATSYPFQSAGGQGSGHGHPPRPQENVPKQGGCFIATATLAGQHPQELAALYSFRDRVLVRSHLGRRMVAMYYQLSPPLAAVLAKSPTTRAIVRRVLVLPLARFLRAWWLRSAKAG